MGFYDGKINGSNAKTNEDQQTAENAQPEHSGAAEAAAKNDPFASMTPQERETLRRAQEIADQQKAIREAAGIKEPERMSKEERNVMKDEIVELPFSIDCSIMPYQDTNGNNVCVKMFGKVTAKALYDPSNKEILALTVKSAPQQAYFDILMRQQVPADQLQNCIMELKQKMADVLKNARDFEIQSIDITSISG